MYTKHHLSFALAASVASIASAADCYGDKPFSGDTANFDSAQAALLVKKQVADVCKSASQSLQNNENTYNWADILFHVKDAAGVTDENICRDSMNQIAQQCIEEQKVWGGSWTYGGREYSIQSNVYPGNPFAWAVALIPSEIESTGAIVKQYSEDPSRKDDAVAALTAAVALASLSGAPAVLVSSLSTTLTAAIAGTDVLAPWAAVEAAAGGSPDPGHPDEGHTPSEGEPDEGQDEDDEKEEEEDLVCPAPEPPVDLVIIRDETKPKAIETRVTIKYGCVGIIDAMRCQGDDAYVVKPESEDATTNTATFYGKIPGATDQKTVTAGCKLDGKWPANWGDVYYDEDCLKDSSGNVIDNQCCTETTDHQLDNPYYKEPQPEKGGDPPTEVGQNPPSDSDEEALQKLYGCPGVKISELTCYDNCRGYVPCGDWCIAKCGGLNPSA